MDPIIQPFDKGTFQGQVRNNEIPAISGHYPAYDRLYLDHTLPPNNDRVLFQTAVQGQREGRTLTYADTNNSYGNRIPDKQKFEYFWLNVGFQCNNAETALMDEEFLDALYDLIANTYIFYKIDTRDPEFILPLWKFFGKMQGYVQSATAVMQGFGPNWSGEWKIEKKIVLAAGVIGGLHIALPNGTSPAILDGSKFSFEFEAKRDFAS